MNTKIRRQIRHAGLAGMLALAPALTFAAPWEYGVQIDAGVIHTNNLLLAPGDAEENETVYTISPEFFLRTDGERTQADLRYRPEAFFYKEFDSADDVYHIIDADFSTSLIQDRLFLYLSGANFQSIVTPEGVLPTSNLPVTSNRIDSRTFEIRPSWRQRIGPADLYLDVGYRDLEYDGDQFQSATETDSTFSLDNFAAQQGFAWGARYSFRRMEYDLSTPFEFHRAELSLGVWASSALRLFVSGGQETAFDNFLDPNLDEGFYEFGYQYAPNQRLNIEMAAGDRSYGSSFRADVSYRLRRGAFGLRYEESPSNRAEAVFDNRPLVDTDSLDSILDRPGNTDRFVRKRGEVSLNIELSKSDLTLRAFVESRENRTTADGAPLTNEDLTGGAARWEWRFGPKTTLDIGVDLARRDDVGREDELTRFELGIAYRLGQKTRLRLVGMRSSQDDKLSDQFDYTENQLRLLVSLDLP